MNVAKNPLPVTASKKEEAEKFGAPTKRQGGDKRHAKAQSEWRDGHKVSDAKLVESKPLCERCNASDEMVTK